MHVTIVYIHVIEEYVEAFITASRINHKASVRESGNCRFDVLQSADDPACFVLYEAYKSKEDAAAHKETAHYLTWRNTVEKMMKKPRQGVVYKGLLPNKII